MNRDTGTGIETQISAKGGYERKAEEPHESRVLGEEGMKRTSGGRALIESDELSDDQGFERNGGVAPRAFELAFGRVGPVQRPEQF